MLCGGLRPSRTARRWSRRLAGRPCRQRSSRRPRGRRRCRRRGSRQPSPPTPQAPATAPAAGQPAPAAPAEAPLAPPVESDPAIQQRIREAMRIASRTHRTRELDNVFQEIEQLEHLVPRGTGAREALDRLTDFVLEKADRIKRASATGPGKQNAPHAPPAEPPKTTTTPASSGERLPAQGHPVAELLTAIRVVAAGDALLAPSVTRPLTEEVARSPDPGQAGPAAPEGLPRRGGGVLALVARGRSNAARAERLVGSEATAKTHISRILAKLHARGRARLVMLASEPGLARPRRS